MEKKSSSKKSSSKGKKKSSHRVHKMHISRTDNDKYLAEHEFEAPEMGMAPKGETHSLNTVDELADHVKEHMGAPEEEAAAAPAAPAAEPGPAAGAM